jgi:tetratricopeptide (TPR) repeat protein
LAPGSLEAIKARGWYAYYVQDDFQGALATMHEAERMAPSDGDVLWGIAYLQHRVGEFAEGNRTMKRAVDLDPRNAGLLFDLANMLGRVAKWDAAKDVLERALAIDPSNALAQRYRVNVVKHAGDPGTARRLATEMGLEPANFGLNLSDLALFDRDYDGAAQILGQIPYDSASASARLAWVGVLAQSAWVEQLRQGDPGPLLDSLRAFLGPDSTVPGELGDLFWEAVARILIGQEEAGTQLIERMVEDARSSPDKAWPPAISWVAARTYAQFGKTEQALALLDEAVARPSTGWWSAAEMRLDPRYDSLREDPRFDELVARQEAYEAAQAREAESEDWLP